MAIESSQKYPQKFEPPQYAHRNSTSGSNIRKDNKKASHGIDSNYIVGGSFYLLM